MPNSSKNTNENNDFNVGRDFHQGDVTHITNQFVPKDAPKPHHLTNTIPSNADHIIGREGELAAVAQFLNEGKPTVLMNGIGGMGKTAAATKFVVTQGHRYAHLAWLTVQSGLMEAFIGDRNLLKNLGLVEEVEACIQNKQLDKAVDAVFYQLNTLGNTLVVLDNANDLSDLVTHKRLFDTATCHFLITSRNAPQAWATVNIERLPDDKALALFRQHAPAFDVGFGMLDVGLGGAGVGFVRPKDTDLLGLLERLTFHTLLIELVAKSAQASAIPFETLNRIIQEKFIHHDLLHKRKVETGGHGDSLTDNAKRAKVQDYIWLIFQNITDIGELQQLTLKAFALLPTATAFTDDFVAEHLKTFGLEDDVYERLDHLVERGWLESVHKEGLPAYKMHPLIADVVVKHLSVDVAFAEDYIMRVANLIEYDNTNPEHQFSEKKGNLPFAERLTDLFFDENTEGVSELLYSLNWLNQNLGFYEKAVQQGERALMIAQSLSNENNALIAQNQSTLATAYQHLGKYVRAAELLETALASDLRSFGAEHRRVAICQSNLARSYQKLGQYERAKFLLEMALASDLKNFGANDPAVDLVQSNLVLVYQDLGQYDRAITLGEKVLANTIINLGEEHPSVATRQNNLAWVYYQTDRRTEAKVLWQAAYINYLKNLGAEHPYTVKFREYSEME